MPPILLGQAAFFVFVCLILFSHSLHLQGLSLHTLVVLEEDGVGVETDHADNAGNHQEGLLIANLAMKWYGSRKGFWPQPKILTRSLTGIFSMGCGGAVGAPKTI